MLTPVTLSSVASPPGLDISHDARKTLVNFTQMNRQGGHLKNGHAVINDASLEPNPLECTQSQKISHDPSAVDNTEVGSNDLPETVRPSLFDAPLIKKSILTSPAKNYLHHIAKASIVGSSSDTDISCDHSANEDQGPCSFAKRNVDNAHQHSSPKSRNIFYICNSPSPTNVNGFLRNPHDKPLRDIHLMVSDTYLDTPLPGGNGLQQRHKSLFDNTALALDLTLTSSIRLSRSRHHSLTREYTQDISSSSTEISEDDDYSSEDVESDREISHLNRRRSSSRTAGSAQLDDNDWVSLSSGDDSNSEGLGVDPNPRDGLFTKSTRSKNALSAHPHLNEPFVDSRSQKRNSLPAIIKTKSLLSTMMSSSLYEDSLARQATSVKDAALQLRRSCTAETMRLPLYREQSRAGLRRPSLAGQCERLDCFDFKGGHQASCLNLCDLNKSGSLSVKQKSSVGLSNYTVVARSSSATINSTEPYPQPIRDLVSKSALNLTKLYRTSVSRLSNLADHEGKHSDADPLKIRHCLAPLNWSIQTQHSDDILTDSSAQLHVDPSSVSSPDFDHGASPCCVDEKWLANQDRLRSSDVVPTQKAAKTIILTNRKTVAIIVGELSQSLRDSIDKDHKLGKIPMPDRVVHSEAIPDIDMNANDYHSTGW